MRLTRTRRYMLLRNAAKRLAPGQRSEHGPLDDSADLEDAEPVMLELPAGVPKPRVGLVKDVDDYPYWTKYRRFLAANDVPYEIYDIHRSTWRQAAESFDMVVWRPMSFPFELDECRRKFHVLEQLLGKVCHPSFAEVMLYEDKLLQYEVLRQHDLPVIDTFITSSLDEALAHVAVCGYPAVWKLSCGSGSLGVELARDRRTAERWLRQAFSFAGRATYWPYVGQKNYVYLQRLEPNSGWDVRCIVVGDAAFGYYRDVPPGEFRASGMGTVRREAPPAEAVRIARRLARALDLPQVAVDLLESPSDGRLSIIEFSSFIQIGTPRQLTVDGVPGMLVFSDDDTYEFVPAKVWLQELTLKRVMETRWTAAARLREEGGR